MVTLMSFFFLPYTLRKKKNLNKINSEMHRIAFIYLFNLQVWTKTLSIMSLTDLSRRSSWMNKTHMDLWRKSKNIRPRGERNTIRSRNDSSRLASICSLVLRWNRASFTGRVSVNQSPVAAEKCLKPVSTAQELFRSWPVLCASPN